MSIKLKIRLFGCLLFFTEAIVFGMEHGCADNILQLPKEIFVNRIVQGNLLQQNPLYKAAILRQVCQAWNAFFQSNYNIKDFLSAAAKWNDGIEKSGGNLSEKIESPLFDIRYARASLEDVMYTRKNDFFIKLLQNDDFSFTPAMVKRLVLDNKESGIFSMWCEKNSKLPEQSWIPLELIIRFDRKKLLVENFFLHEAIKSNSLCIARDLIKWLSPNDCNMPNVQGERPLCLVLQNVPYEHECASFFCFICHDFTETVKALLKKGADPLLQSVVGKDGNNAPVTKNAMTLIQEPCFDRFSRLREKIVKILQLEDSVRTIKKPRIDVFGRRYYGNGPMEMEMENIN